MVFDREIITKSPQETAKVGQELGHHLVKSEKLKVKSGEEEKGAKIICLYGELGSGKTTFVQGLAKGLGIKSRLLSPTFIIVRRYLIPDLDSFFYHLDLYRLNEARDLNSLGLAEIFSQTGNLVVVEWAEKLGELLPKDRIDIWLKTLDNGRHEVVVKKV